MTEALPTVKAAAPFGTIDEAAARVRVVTPVAEMAVSVAAIVSVLLPESSVRPVVVEAIVSVPLAVRFVPRPVMLLEFMRIVPPAVNDPIVSDAWSKVMPPLAAMAPETVSEPSVPTVVREEVTTFEASVVPEISPAALTVMVVLGKV